MYVTITDRTVVEVNKLSNVEEVISEQLLLIFIKAFSPNDDKSESTVKQIHQLDIYLWNRIET